MYDRVLQVPVPKQPVVGFADDLELVITSNHTDKVGMNANESSWLKDFRPKQTAESVLLICFGAHMLHSQPSLKYLGVTFKAEF